jgi:pyruvate dehydrogenase E2 component (dihydrolipoamide acetyltransferase)
VRGSERGGRIVMADLWAYVQQLQLASPATRHPPPVTRESIDFSKWGPVEKKPFTPLRQTIAQRMTASWSAIPHVTQFDEADITDLLALKQRYDAAYEQRGARLTLTAFILKAVAAQLQAHPKFNASLDEASNELVEKRYYHLGVAVDTEAGLVVPVIRDVDKKPLLQVSRELNELAEKTRQRKVAAEELQGGTFSISNQGGIGGGHFTPIIKKPEVAILGIGKGVQKPVIRGGKAEPRLMLPLALSYDHRVIDGADAARFIVDLVKAIEQFPEADIAL